MEKRRRFVGGLELSLQLFATGIQRLDLSLVFVHRDLVIALNEAFEPFDTKRKLSKRE